MNQSRNKTISCSPEEITEFSRNLIHEDLSNCPKNCHDIIINGDVFKILPNLPDRFVDLMVADPPYNMDKDFNQVQFRAMTNQDYILWLNQWLPMVKRILKPNASLYICGDWRSSSAIEAVCAEHFIIQNRITFEREKGRGAKNNWKNCSEDIWFCTNSKDYYFNVDAVKTKKKVIAPYKNAHGAPKDWQGEQDGNFRLTYPSNIWTDITIPFWSMAENTEHPTQKPEKLLAKIILASSKEGDVVFDPFLGSGTTAVVAKKLNRRYCGIDIDKKYCAISEKRLNLAQMNHNIQGYYDGYFWERNSSNQQK